MTSLDIVEAQNFSIINVKYLNVGHSFFIEQAKAQVEYARHISELSAKLKTKTFRLVSEDSCPGIDVLFKNVKQLCNDNPRFKDSIIVSLFRAAIAKNKHVASSLY